MCLVGRASQNQRDGLKSVVSDAVLPLIPAVLEEEDPMPLYALKLLVVLLDTHPTWALHLQRYAPNPEIYGTEYQGTPTWASSTKLTLSVLPYSMLQLCCKQT